MHKYGRSIHAYSPTVPIFLVHSTLDYKNTKHPRSKSVSESVPTPITVLLHTRW